jgi:hypothetical protein
VREEEKQREGKSKPERGKRRGKAAYRCISRGAKESMRWQGRRPGNLHAGAPCLSEEDNHHFAKSPLALQVFHGTLKQHYLQALFLVLQPFDVPNYVEK